MDLPWVELSRNLGYTILGELWPLQNAAELLPWAIWLVAGVGRGMGPKEGNVPFAQGRAWFWTGHNPQPIKCSQFLDQLFFFFFPAGVTMKGIQEFLKLGL